MPEHALVRRPAESRLRWAERLHGAFAGGGVSAAFQPVADLARGTIAGYEAVARFAEPSGVGPERWLAIARRHHIGGALEALCLLAAFAARPDLPPDTFLAVNIGPDALLEPPVQAVLAEQGDLSGVVIEITEQSPRDSYEALLPVLDRYRSLGALVAVEDAGAGYAGLRHLLLLRPSIIRLDHDLVAGIDRDEAKRALVEMVGAFADRTDAWLLAAGVERPEELLALSRLGVPLAVGPLLGDPAARFAAPTSELARLVPPRVQAVQPERLGDLVEERPVATDLAGAARLLGADHALDVVVLVDRAHRPRELVESASRRSPRRWPAVGMALETPIAEAARRALGRPDALRFQPLICTDQAGHFRGVVTMERILDHLAGLCG